MVFIPPSEILLRNWFAGQALAGLCAREDLATLTFGQLAARAYKLGAAMTGEQIADEQPIRAPAKKPRLAGKGE